VSRARGTTVAIALLWAALAAAGCGFGPGADVGGVELTVTREYGSVPMLSEKVDDVTESDTVMRVLERHADITTRYGGGFVQSIGGVEESQGGGEPFDWFFYVNGVESPVGAADYEVEAGDRIWWDYRDWVATAHVPVVVGAWPAPLRGGYEGETHPVTLECAGAGAACSLVRAALAKAGVEVSDGDPKGAIRVLVGPWEQLRSDSTAAMIGRGPGESGVYAELSIDAGGTPRLHALDEGGDDAGELGPDAGLVAATRRYEAPPVWVVTGTSPAGVRAAAGLLNPAALRNHYAVAIAAGQEQPLPVKGG
jgi:hypothetical protein